MSIVCREVISNQDIEQFIEFPHQLYKDDPHYVPEVYIGQKAIFNKKSYPFYKYGQAKLFLAYHHDKVAGRIAAIYNPAYQKLHETKAGFFGFFDCIDNQEIAGVLFQCVKDYLTTHGCTSLIGPTNYTTNETAGLLVDGFDSPPSIMMTYNFPYYSYLIENQGLRKEMDLLAYDLRPETVSHKASVLAAEIEERLQKNQIIVRPVRKSKLKEEALKIKEIYNTAWKKNWGFTPFTDEEFDFIRKDLSSVINPAFTYIAEKNGKAVGFSITLPNVNEILIKNKRGRLLPFGIFRLLTGKNKTKSLRILALGVLPEYRNSGIDVLFYAKTLDAAKKRNITKAEASWILENNKEMNLALQKLNGVVSKTYRLYSCNLIS